jgi:chitinase
VTKLPEKVVFSTFLLAVTLHGGWITGFYAAQNGIQPPSAIPWGKYTHIVHFAAAPGAKASVDLHYLTKREIGEFIGSRPQGKKALVCIKDNDGDLNAFARDTEPGLMDEFVANIAGFVKKNRYDGVDIDWEKNVNVAQYTQLIARLRAALPDQIVTVDVGNWGNLEKVAAASQANLDQINVACYDMDVGNGYSWYNSALLQNGNASVMTCDWRINAFTKAGVAAARIGVGIPFYGRRWTGVTQALVKGNFSSSTVQYNQLVTDVARWQPQYQGYDKGYRSNYLSIPRLKEFDSYTGPQALADTASWIKSRGFGGVMTYSLHYEYLAGQAGDDRYPLSTALYNAISSSRDSTPPEAAPVIPSKADFMPSLLVSLFFGTIVLILTGRRLAFSLSGIRRGIKGGPKGLAGTSPRDKRHPTKAYKLL